MLPGAAAVGRAEYPPFGVLPEGMAQRCRIDQVVVPWMHLDAADLPGLAQSDEGPAPPGVHRLPCAPPGRRVPADVHRPFADVDHVRVRIGDPDGADRASEVPVGDVAPCHPVVIRFPHAAAGRAHQPAVGVVREAGRRRRAPAAIRTRHAVPQVLEGEGVELLGGGGSGGYGRCRREGRHRPESRGKRECRGGREGRNQRDRSNETG